MAGHSIPNGLASADDGTKHPSGRKRVAIISNNLSAGSALACVSIARALAPHFQVRIFGTFFGRSPWPGILDGDIEVLDFPVRPLPLYVRTMYAISRSIDADVVIAHQFRLSSFGTALLHRFRTRTRFAVYLDDDDIALTTSGRSQPFRKRIRNVNGDLTTRLISRLRNREDALFCGSRHFRDRFGGTVVPLGRDPTRYNPDTTDRAGIRRELGFGPRDIVLGFMGNPRPHVGIEDLAKAVEQLHDPDVVVLIVPSRKLNAYARTLLETTSARVQVLEEMPSTSIPGLLAASDMVAVPQRSENYSVGQLPARLVEAMAMAKPIIATRVADLSRFLEESAMYIDERNPAQLAQAIAWIKANPEEAARRGALARQVFLSELTLEAMANRLVPRLNDLMAD